MQNAVRRIYIMSDIIVKTSKKKEIVNITNLVNSEIAKENISSGVCVLFAKHTTVSLTIADLDPGTDLDILDAFDAIIPKLKYRHPHDPSHVGDHILSALAGCCLTIPITGGICDLGTWQNIVLVELNGPRIREISIKLVKSD